MPFKLIGMIVLLVVVTVFCGFNSAENARCDVNLLFRQFHDVPVFLTVLVSFVTGAVVALPFTFGRRRKTQDKAGQPAKTGAKSKETPSSHGAPEVKVTVRPGTLYDATPIPPAAASGASGSGEKAQAKTPFAAARENAKAEREKRLAEKAEKAARKLAQKRAKAKKAPVVKEPAAPSVNDVPKIL